MPKKTLPPFPPPGNVRLLAAYLAEHDLPGRRSMTAITRLRRARNHHLPDSTPSVEQRLHDRLMAEVEDEIIRRGGETSIAGPSGASYRLRMVDRDPTQRLVLVRVSGKRHYSRREGAWSAAIAYLSGVDDAGRWAVRVPSTTYTVRDALRWIEPTAVAQARAAGKRIKRQGDVYAVETAPQWDGMGQEDLPAGHEWRPAARYLVHRPEDGRRHRPLRIAYPVRFVRQTVLQMGRGNGRGAGD